MRRVLSLLFASVLVLLGSAAQAQAQIINCTGNMSGGNENPPLISGSGGPVSVTMDVAAGTIQYLATAFNFPSGLTAGHIHAGAPGVNGPVVINFVITPNVSNDFAVQGTATVAGFVARPAQGVNSMEDVAQMLLANQAYVNLHSQINGGGEIRAPLSCVLGSF
jgi:hypothetical protein